jgi:hypothetical protein
VTGYEISLPLKEYEMRQRIIITVLLMCAITIVSAPGAAQSLRPNSYPYVLLSNGLVETSVFLPDRDTGYYRSTRYEWSGMTWQIAYKGHTYVAEIRNFTPHDPMLNDHGMGLAEEFGIGTSVAVSPRYEEAAPGETFVKIGTGLLEKPENDPRYRFNTPYKLTEDGTWSTNHGESWVAFEHRLHDKFGYGYTYHKRMELTPGEPELVISHTLTNTGTQPIHIDQYCHNFFSIDDVPIGPDYHIELPFAATLSIDLAPIAGIEGNRLVFHRDVEKPIFTIISGFGTDPDDGSIVLRNTNTNAAVAIGGNFPLSGFNFWTDGQVISPELFVLIDIAQGESYSWDRTYTFIAD